MINVRETRMCKHNGCNTRPCFNYKGETKAIYCVEHKLKDMIDVKHRICQHNGCDTRPNFNYKGETKAIYCSKHKLKDMIDITHDLCHCGTRAHFGYPSQKSSSYVYSTKKME